LVQDFFSHETRRPDPDSVAVHQLKQVPSGLVDKSYARKVDRTVPDCVFGNRRVPTVLQLSYPNAGQPPFDLKGHQVAVFVYLDFHHPYQKGTLRTTSLKSKILFEQLVLARSAMQTREADAVNIRASAGMLADSPLTTL